MILASYKFLILPITIEDSEFNHVKGATMPAMGESLSEIQISPDLVFWRALLQNPQTPGNQISKKPKRVF